MIFSLSSIHLRHGVCFGRFYPPLAPPASTTDGETHQVHEGGGTGTALPATATASASASAAASSSSCNTSGAALRRLGLQSCVGCRWQRLMGPTAAGGW